METVKEYLRRIGSKGGKIGGKALKGTPQAKERAAKAAKARWAKRKGKKDNHNETNENSIINRATLR